MTKALLGAGLTAAALTVSGAATAATFTADLGTLNPSSRVNGSGLDVTGLATLTLNGNILTVDIEASGLVPGQQHAQHIHGRFNDDGSARQSVPPTIADDSDGDGVVEVLEGVPAYGDVILPLFVVNETGVTNMFPTANEDGTLSFSASYDISDNSLLFSPVTGTEFMTSDLLPLNLREVVLHGAFLDGSQGMPSDRLVNEADGTAGYKPNLPVAAGTIAAVPVPAAAWMLIAAMGGLFGARRLRA